MAIRIVRLGTARAPDEGPRLGAVRRPPWTDARWRSFVKAYRREMTAPAPRQMLELLAQLSRHANFSVGCYCEDESRCHRSVLRGLLAEQGARLE